MGCTMFSWYKCGWRIARALGKTSLIIKLEARFKHTNTHTFWFLLLGYSVGFVSAALRGYSTVIRLNASTWHSRAAAFTHINVRNL